MTVRAMLTFVGCVDAAPGFLRRFDSVQCSVQSERSQTIIMHFTIATRIWFAIGSMVLFGATWFAFWIYLLMNLYSGMRN